MEISPIHPRQTSLAPWEASMIDVFVRAANLIGLPRSIGEIYGLLYSSGKPLSFDELVGKLNISKGSVSQGLKVLRQLGAVQLHYVAGSRKDHYRAELSMKRLVRGFLKDQFEPHLSSGAERLDGIEALILEEADEVLRDHAMSRLQTLRSWQGRTRKLMPIITAVLGGSQFLENDSSDNPPMV